MIWRTDIKERPNFLVNKSLVYDMDLILMLVIVAPIYNHGCVIHPIMNDPANSKPTFLLVVIFSIYLYTLSGRTGVTLMII